MSERKVCVVTGTRAEYGLLRPVMEKIKKSRKLKLQVIATGMHLLPKFGCTVKEIRKDGFKVDAKVPILQKGSKESSMAVAIGKGVIGITKALEKLKPDVVLLLGDRFEALAAAVAAAYSGRVVAHISGGDSPRAGFDEYSRHAITKISHIHFPATKKSAERIVKLGENPKHVFNVGSTALDTILDCNFASRDKVCRKHGLNTGKPFVLLVQHPLSTNPVNSAKEMRATLEAVTGLGLQSVVIYPNADPGGAAMIPVIEGFAKRHLNLIKAYKSLPFEDYLGVMKNADVMVGNSSSGIIESPAFGLPVVNIGTRQLGRERAKNVIDVPHEKAKIKKAIRKALGKAFREKARKCGNPYGKGKASAEIVRVLERIKIDKKLIQKKITY